MRKLTPKVYLRDTNQLYVAFLKKYFNPFPEVEVSHGDIFEVKAEAIVSPANSFGDMGGGIDLAYRNKFGTDVEKQVKRIINARWYDELPVGQAISVPLKNQDYKHLIVAPTMRLPMNVDNSLNTYFSFRAALLKAKDLDVESILVPGMGTGTGGACPELATRQMFVAYLNVVCNRSPKNLEHIFKQMHWMLRCTADEKRIKQEQGVK
jgi:O-acetyl-ADP-ribose deacetylase (regulator of RNase III)